MQVPYSPTRRAGDLVFVSGQLGWCDGVLAESFATQARLCLDNLRDALAAEGAGLDDVVQCTVYLADLEDWECVNAVFRETLTAPFPARTAVGAALGPGVRIEVDAVAHAPR